MHKRELPDPDRVVDDHVRDRGRGEPCVQLTQRGDLFVGWFGGGCGRAMLARRRRVSRVRSRRTILPSTIEGSGTLPKGGSPPGGIPPEHRIRARIGSVAQTTVDCFP
jgi:hypothetical protein